MIKLSDSKTCTIHNMVDDKGFTIGHVIITEESVIGTCINDYEKDATNIINSIDRPIKSLYSADHVELLEIDSCDS